ncbi:hypothetical protein O6H91_06G065300 [Diphasiastrum complanatum]|uniref:Uncharacterized protein n=1 Tax=Diphasiastrum complanatum TaxID=34168 RepID=A0ACC2DF32_DIPCM|nr:hypothetical protein O6H91_06G065300 [Diphasiastrum complanatum]
MAAQIGAKAMRALGGLATHGSQCYSRRMFNITKHFEASYPVQYHSRSHGMREGLLFSSRDSFRVFLGFSQTLTELPQHGKKGSFLSPRCFNQESKSAEETAVEVDGAPLEGKDYKYIKAELVENGAVGVVLLNRPKVLNALSLAVMHEVIDAYKTFDSLSQVGAIVITGQGKAFAAGVDINELKEHNLVNAFVSQFIFKWSEVATIQKPIIAAVNGYALGGGCEVAMMSDIILVGEKAIFGQPEIKLAAIPGMGGTQRLIREVGKSRAMEMILTGKAFINAEEACQRGLASRLVPGTNQALLAEAITLARTISESSRPVVIMAKAAVNAAYELGLHEGVRKERDLFGAAFGLEDNKEGMSAFLEKRKPNFNHR